MMTSSNGNIFRATGHLCGEFTGPQWITPTPYMVLRERYIIQTYMDEFINMFSVYAQSGKHSRFNW